MRRITTLPRFAPLSPIILLSIRMNIYDFLIKTYIFFDLFKFFP